MRIIGLAGWSGSGKTTLLAGDGEIIAQIYKERVAKRGYGSGAWGWKTAYRETIGS